jgi:hypothetical protein
MANRLPGVRLQFTPEPRPGNPIASGAARHVQSLYETARAMAVAKPALTSASTIKLGATV